MPCRKIGLFLRRFPQIGTDVVALLDEWAVHFFEELDYVHEVDCSMTDPWLDPWHSSIIIF